MSYDVREYLTAKGESPYRNWLERLTSVVRARIEARIFRFELGHLGDVKAVGGGVYEARFMFGPGYRVYFGRDSETIILLLCGGEKNTQRRDITMAKEYWRDYGTQENA